MGTPTVNAMDDQGLDQLRRRFAGAVASFGIAKLSAESAAQIVPAIAWASAGDAASIDPSCS